MTRYLRKSPRGNTSSMCPPLKYSQRWEKKLLNPAHSSRELHTHEMCVKNINTECVRTNLWNKGLISVDRRTKPTLVLTIPRSVVKSSTKDLSFPIFGIVFQGYAAGHQVVWMAVVCPNLMMLDPKAYSHSLNTGKGEYRRFPAWILT